MARQDECVNFEVGISYQHVERAGHVLMRGIDAEVFKTHGRRAFDGHGHERGGGFKTHAHKYHGAIGVFFGDGKRIQWRIHNAHVAAIGLLFQQGRRASRDACHVAEGGQNHIRNARERNDGVDVVVAGDANGTSRSAREAAAFGHEVANAVARNGHGVGAAHLHEGCLFRRKGLDALDESTGKHGVFKAVLVNHGYAVSTSASSGNSRIRSSVSWACSSDTTSMAKPA